MKMFLYYWRKNRQSGFKNQMVKSMHATMPCFACLPLFSYLLELPKPNIVLFDVVGIYKVWGS